MLHAIKELLVGSGGSRRLTDNMPETSVAVCALLLDAAEADDNFTPEERTLIKNQLRKRFSLDEQGVEDLLRETQAQRAAAPDSWQFTHAIRAQYTPEQKRELLVLVWQILLSDEKLTAGEELWARRLHEMLAVNHSLLIDAKLRAREILAGPTPASA